MNWFSHLENDIPDNYMNATLLNILKQSTKPIIERDCQSKIILLVAFGGHTAHKINGQLVVTRRNAKRFSVSDILSRHTAGFLRSVYNKINLDSLNRVLPGSWLYITSQAPLLSTAAAAGTGVGSVGEL